MQIDWWTLGLQAVNVLILVWLLARFQFKPVVAIAERRREETAAALESARAAGAAADAQLARVHAQTEELAAAREYALRQALAEVEAQRTQLLEQARIEAERLRQSVRADGDRQQEQDRRRLALMAGQLAADIAARLLSRMPMPAPAQFLPGLVASLQSLPAAAREDMIASGPVLLRSAHELGTDDINTCQQALAAALGRPLTLQVEVDPDLVAGLEIRTPHAVVSNHFRADLERIATELAADGNNGQ